MADRSTLTQVVQIGVEATPGATGTTVTKKLQTLNVEPSPRLEVDAFRAAGSKYQTLTAMNKEWVAARVTGKGSYTEIIYPLSSIVNTAVVTTPGGGTNSRTWTFTSSTSTEDTPKTFAVQHGSTARADSFNYGLFTELTMNITRSAVDIGGSMIGQRLTDGVTLTTGGVTTVALKPILPTQVSVYMDDTAGAIGSTKLTRAISVDFSLGSRFNPIWVLDSSYSSYAGHIEAEPDLQLNLMVEADAQGMGLLNTVRSSATKYIRVEAIGETIEGSIPYRFRLDFCGQVRDTGGFRDSDGLYAIEWSLVGINDPAWGSGKAFEFAITNALLAL